MTAEKLRHLIVTNLTSTRDNLLRAYSKTDAKVNFSRHCFELEGESYRVIAGVVPSDLDRLRGEVFASIDVHPYTSKDVRDRIPEVVRLRDSHDIDAGGFGGGGA